MPLIDRRRLVIANSQQPVIWILSEDESSIQTFPVQPTGVDGGIGPADLWCDDEHRIISSFRRSSPQGWFWYHYENGVWTRQALQMAAGPAWAIDGTSYQNVWSVVNQQERIYHWNGFDWVQDANVGGSDLVDISTYGPGLNDVVVIGWTSIWFRTGGDRGSGTWANQWAQMVSDTGVGPYSPGIAIVHAVSANEIYLGLNTSGNWIHIVRWNGSVWQIMANSGGNPQAGFTRGRSSNLGSRIWAGTWDPQGAAIWYYDGGSSLTRRRALVGSYLGHTVAMRDAELGYSVGEGGAIPQGDRWFVTKTTDGLSFPTIINNQFNWISQWHGADFWGAPPIPAIPRVLDNDREAEYCLDISDDKHNSLTDGFELLRDYTIQSRVRFRLTCRREQWWANADVGSRLYTLNTLGQAQIQAQEFCEEAVQDLLDRGELISITVTEVTQDPIAGTLQAAVVLEVPDGEAIDLGLIPVGA